MDQSSQSGSSRLVTFSYAAEIDLAEIHTHTAANWGIEQAHRYVEFLADAAEDLATGRLAGSPIVGREGRFTYTAKWPSAKSGHRIIYELPPEELYVVRVLHTAMHLLRHV